MSFTKKPSPQLRTVLAWLDAYDPVNFDAALSLVTDSFVFETTGTRNHHILNKAEFEKHFREHLIPKLLPGKPEIRDVVETPGKIILRTVGGPSLLPKLFPYQSNIVYLFKGDKIDRIEFDVDPSKDYLLELDAEEK